MSTAIPRREALHRLLLVSAGAALAACSRKPSCADVSGLSPDEQTARRDMAAYSDTSSDPSKKCVQCIQFVAGAPDACGSCKVVKGPINPEGTCKLFVAKPS